MRSFMVCSAFALIISAAVAVAGDQKSKVPSTKLADAVKAFNENAAKDEIGKHEPPLTEDEVVASIHFWSKAIPPNEKDKYYEAFQKIANSRQLPNGTKLTSYHSVATVNGFSFDGWWISLELMNPDGTGYGHQIRQRFLKSTFVGNNGPHLEIAPIK